MDKVNDKITLDIGPYNTDWWESAVLAELKKNQTPWGEDKIIPIEENGELKIRITKEMLDDYDPVNNPKGRNIWKTFLKYEEVGPIAIAGIRHVMNISNLHDTRQVKNSFERLLTTMSLGLMVKIAYNKGPDYAYNANYAHEVRYHSREFQEIAVRTLCAMGFICHVMPENEVTAIWNCSTMGKFFCLPLSMYGTSSHSESQIDGLKIMDFEGSQFLITTIEAMISIQRAILEDIKLKGHMDFYLSSKKDEKITDQLYKITHKGMFVYDRYQRKTAADEYTLGLLKQLKPDKIYIDCMHGSGFKTLSNFFSEIGMKSHTDKINWVHTEEMPDFGNIGKLRENPKNGKKEIFDLGADGSQIYEKVVGDKAVPYFPVLLTADYMDIFQKMDMWDIMLYTDQDNDRLMVSQIVPNDDDTRTKLSEIGVMYNIVDEKKLNAVFIPNKFFHMLHEINFDRLKYWMDKKVIDKERTLVVLKTHASIPAVDKWANSRKDEGYNVEVINTAVGFAKLANVMYRAENFMKNNPGKDIIITDGSGKDINIGMNPIILSAWEESGGIIAGITFGFADLLGNQFLAEREKSSTESIFLSLSLLARLQKENEEVNLVKYLDYLYTRDKIDTPIDIRYDNKLFVPGTSKESSVAEKEGNQRKNRIFGAYLSIAVLHMRNELTIAEAKKILHDIFKEEYEERKASAKFKMDPVLVKRFGEIDFSHLSEIHFTGDGVMHVFERDGKNWHVFFRPSGTEPKLKSYGFGQDIAKLSIDAWAFAFNENIKGNLPDSFTKNKKLMEFWGDDGEKAVNKARVMQSAWEDFGLVVDTNDPNDLKRLSVTWEDLEKRRLVRSFSPPDDHIGKINNWLSEQGLKKIILNPANKRSIPLEQERELLDCIPDKIYEKLGKKKKDVLSKYDCAN